MSRTLHQAQTRAQWLKHHAKELGFTSVGISKAEHLDEEAPRLELGVGQRDGRMLGGRRRSLAQLRLE